MSQLDIYWKCLYNLLALQYPNRFFAKSRWQLFWLQLFNIRGTKTSVNIDNVEERKIQEHCNYVTAKLEKLHKNIMWNIYVGRSYLDKVAATSREGAIKMGQFGSLASLYS